MAINYTTLKTECQTNPNGYSDSGFTLAQAYSGGFDQLCANMLNASRAAVQIKRADISPSEIFHALDLTDLVTNAGATANSYLESLLTAPYNLRLVNDDGTNTPVQTNVLALLKTGSSATKTRLVALQTRDGSRAEQLFGAGTFITALDIVQSRSA